MKGSPRWFLLLALPGCSVLAGLDGYAPGTDPPPFAELPDAHGANDGMQDTGADTGASDTSANDAILDTHPMDSGADMSTDAAPDAMTDAADRDASPDATSDAAPDAAPDASSDAPADVVQDTGGPGPCDGAPLVHKNGFNQFYDDCVPLGMPGQPNTYTRTMATEAAVPLFINGASNFDYACGASLGYAKSNGQLCAVWGYTGPIAGFAVKTSSLDGGDPCSCPNPSTDATWN